MYLEIKLSFLICILFIIFFLVHSDGRYIVAGSDDGSIFFWDRQTENNTRILRGDTSIVNCLQPHPECCLLATSGIDHVVRLWTPFPEVYLLVCYYVICVYHFLKEILHSTKAILRPKRPAKHPKRRVGYPYVLSRNLVGIH